MMKRFSVILFISLLLVSTINVMAVSADGPDAIYIDDNSDFAIYASAGDGSVGNPYVIDFKSIKSFSGYGVYVENTDAYAIFDHITLFGTSSGYGFYLKNVSNVNITHSGLEDQLKGILVENCSMIGIIDVDISGGDFGVRIDQSDNILVELCSFDEMLDGIQLWNSFRVAIKDNTFVGTGLSFYGTCQVSTGIQVIGNLVNGLPLGYLYNEHDRQIDIAGYGQAILIQCVNVTLHHGNIDNVKIGVQFIFCQNSIVALSNITNCYYGILIYESSYCRIYANNITENEHGLFGYFAIGTIVYENNYLNNIGYGVWLWYGCSSSSVYLNNFINNKLGNARDDGGIEDSSLSWVAAKFVNAKSGWPLSNVSVLVERAGRSYQAYTNENGLLKLPVPAFGTYDLTISKFRYETKTPSITISTPGVNLFLVNMDKVNLGPGTGFVQARLMSGSNPVEGATVKVYSYLDGGYYFHSQYTSITGGTYAGWVNITGLYYDEYIFVIDHPDYEQHIINQIVIGDGLIGTYNNIQLEVAPTSAFVYGHVYDMENMMPLENVNITAYMFNFTEEGDINGILYRQTIFTDADGFYNMTGLPCGFLSVDISLIDYQTKHEGLRIYEFGSYERNPLDILMTPNDYVPNSYSQAVVNNWDNELQGNYWDDLGGSVVLASSDVYYIFGDNLDNPVDEYPLNSPFVRQMDDDDVLEVVDLWIPFVLSFMGIVAIVVFVSWRLKREE